MDYDDDHMETYEDNDDDEDDQYHDVVDDDYFEDPMPAAAEQAYVVLTPTMLEERQHAETAKICEVLSVQSLVAAILLRHFHWNVEALMNCLFEAGRQQLFRSAGIVDDADCVPDTTPKGTSFDCECCLEAVSYSESTMLRCGHRFCSECWKRHVSIKIREGQARSIKCMQRSCNVIVDEVLVTRFVGASELQKYKKQILESYVDDNTRVRWCPSAPHCGNAVYVSQSSPKVVVQVRCLCGEEFCFNCMNEPHGPATCAMVKSWLQKLEVDGGNTSWLNQNTKDCPICGQPVEKNGGCNLMICRCGAYFCWICGMKTGMEHTWTEIKGHTCGKYKDNFDVDQAKTQLQRFQHYHNRFKANADSAKLELRLLDTLDARIDTLQKLGDGTFSSWDWLAAGIQTLRQCRQVLRWAYTWGYYAFGAQGPTNPYYLILSCTARQSVKNIFEDSQEQLEFLTERLSKELEAPVSVTTTAELNHLRSTVLRMSRAASNRCKGIFDVLEKNVPREDFVEFR